MRLSQSRTGNCSIQLTSCTKSLCITVRSQHVVTTNTFWQRLAKEAKRNKAIQSLPISGREDRASATETVYYWVQFPAGSVLNLRLKILVFITASLLDVQH